MKSRRNFLNHSAITVFGLSTGSTGLISNYRYSIITNSSDQVVSEHYPSTDQNMVREVVGAAHADFDKLKELVGARPELAKATYDWGFGDVESAIGASSHMGRKDMAEFLMSHGARPNIFTWAMMGKIDAVSSIIESSPGVQRIPGPHGITLLGHAKMRLRRSLVEGDEKRQQEELVSYLENLGDADNRALSLDISEEEQKVYFGKYMFGDGENEYFEVMLNRRRQLYMSRGDRIGRVLNRVDQHIFAPGGAPSVRIHFDVVDGKAKKLSIHDPTPILKADLTVS